MSMPVGPKEQVVTFHLPGSDANNTLHNKSDEKIYQSQKEWFSAIAGLRLFGSKEDSTRMRDMFSKELYGKSDKDIKTFLENGNLVHDEQLMALKSIAGQLLYKCPSILEAAKELSTCIFKDVPDSTVDGNPKNSAMTLKLLQKLDGLYDLKAREARRAALESRDPSEMVHLNKGIGSPEQSLKTMKESGVRLTERKKIESESESESSDDEEGSVRGAREALDTTTFESPKMGRGNLLDKKPEDLDDSFGRSNRKKS